MASSGNAQLGGIPGVPQPPLPKRPVPDPTLPIGPAMPDVVRPEIVANLNACDRVLLSKYYRRHPEKRDSAKPFDYLMHLEEARKVIAVSLLQTSAAGKDAFSIELTLRGPPGTGNLSWKLSNETTWHVGPLFSIQPSSIIEPKGDSLPHSNRPLPMPIPEPPQQGIAKPILQPLEPDADHMVTVAVDVSEAQISCGESTARTLPPPNVGHLAGILRHPYAVDLTWSIPPHVTELKLFRADRLLHSLKPPSGTPITLTSFRDTSGPDDPYVNGKYTYSLPMYRYRVETWYGERAHAMASVEVSGPNPMFGFADTHTHQFANLGFGGLAFWGSAFGKLEDLSWCTPAHGPGGIGDTLSNALGVFNHTGGPGHLVGGFPQFDGWPRWNSYAHQQMHEDWLWRAHEGGLQLIVMLAVNNKDLCDIIRRRNDRSCSDSEAVSLQIQEAKRMETDVDNRSGGPGKGWYRLVYSAQEARQAIAKGQMAVVLGVEVDDPLDCSQNAVCNSEDVKSRLEAYFQDGIRHLFPVHFVDNGFGGVGLGHSEFNVLNKKHNGRWFTVENCSTDDAPIEFRLDGLNQFGTLLGIDLSGLGGLPPGPHCNARGLTDLGRVLIDQLIERRMIIDIDHMSKKMQGNVLDIAERRRYPVISGHTGFIDLTKGKKRNEGQLSRRSVERIRALGGMISPILSQGKTTEVIDRLGIHNCSNSSKSWAEAYLYTVEQVNGAAVGYGSDFNGFAGLPGPRYSKEGCNNEPKEREKQTGEVSYPFPIHGKSDQTMATSVIGQRTFDYNGDGLAHVGMVPDFIQDLKIIGLSDSSLEALFRSAEGYLRVWERAEGTRFQ
jgi:microsomal dipeptidase-like Zn-dependent dipeptidase